MYFKHYKRQIYNMPYTLAAKSEKGLKKELKDFGIYRQ